ncbi:unnamed protein product [Brassicogethes aeneus]|uniref:Phenoloxidase-activating factor 2 n=1 Tax=Brassicogethes aeneus TaxID=1431903 RepID=A0A9P0FJF4_BRAAE|nr:unnamed protein product [Brassicogethes aeneus]
MRAAIVLCALALASCQNDNERDAAVNKLFTSATPRQAFDDVYEEVTKKPTESIGAIEKCGEGADKDVHLCVPYYQCDGTTQTIIQDGSRDGFKVIDVRFGANSCAELLDVCCKIPEGGAPDPDKNREPDIDNPVPTPRPTPRPTQRPTSPPLQAGCGIRNTNGVDFKITGNTENEAEYGEFPWMVAILKNNYNPNVDKNLAICGGSLIAPNVVLTGAHCVYNFKINDIKVRAGEWDTQTEKERLPYQERNVVRIITHNDFHQNTLFNDVALLLLDSPIQEAEHIGLVCLPQQNQIIDSTNCFATGWGKDNFGKDGRYSSILKKIELPIVQRQRCQELLRTTRLGIHFNLDKSFTCAGGIAGRDTCTGDGGSPLVCPDPQNPRRYVQAGIVAWGIGCGEEKIPGVYADVAKFRQWVDGQLQQLN